MKHQCRVCFEMATWKYMPSGERDELDRYYCDVCIQRGCSCNENPNTDIEYVDDQGRLLPCCEYDFDEHGFEIEEHNP